MKRDWDLIRRILNGLEEEDDPDRWLMSNQIEGWTQEEAAYHVWLLIQGGLIVGKCKRELPGGKGFACYGICL